MFNQYIILYSLHNTSNTVNRSIYTNRFLITKIHNGDSRSRGPPLKTTRELIVRSADHTSQLDKNYYYEFLETSSFNPFHVTYTFLYPLKTSGSLMFSGEKEREKWYEMGLSGRAWNLIFIVVVHIPLCNAAIFT